MSWNFILEEEVLTEVGKRIKSFRKNAKMSQQELADRVGVSRVIISKIERGANTSMTTFLRIIKLFNRIDAMEEVLRVPTISPKERFENEAKKPRQ